MLMNTNPAIRFILNFCLVLVLLSSTFHNANGLGLPDSNLGDTSPLILLKSREINPDAGINPTIFEDIKKTSAEKIHAILTFSSIPTENEKNVIKDDGVALLDYLPYNSWFVSLSPQLL